MHLSDRKTTPSVLGGGGRVVLCSAHGAAGRHGAFLARSARRRGARETRYLDESVAAGDVDAVGGGAEDDRVTVPPPLRTTLLLPLMELEKAKCHRPGARQRVEECRELEVLQDWLVRAATVASLDEVFEA